MLRKLAPPEVAELRLVECYDARRINQRVGGRSLQLRSHASAARLVGSGCRRTGAAGYPLRPHENLYGWHDCEQRSRSRASGAISYSQLTARLQSLAGGCKDPTGARAYDLVEARLLLRAVVFAVNFIFHHLWQAFVQLSRARILDGTLRQRSPFMNSGAYQPVLAGWSTYPCCAA